MGDEIEKQNRLMQQLEEVVEDTEEHIRGNHETLERNRRKQSNKHFGMYMCCIITILMVVIIILNLLRGIFSPFLVCYFSRGLPMNIRY